MAVLSNPDGHGFSGIGCALASGVGGGAAEAVGRSGDRIRIAATGDDDRCPCIGPHVACTGVIGEFRITATSQ